MKYWTLDYVDQYECELVFEGQLYESEEAAYKARHEEFNRPDLLEVTWYTMKDLEEIFGGPVVITKDLRVERA